MVDNDEKHSKIMKKVPFPSCVQEAHVRLMKKILQMFFIVFDHANACASMHSLVEIHNTCFNSRKLVSGQYLLTVNSFEDIRTYQIPLVRSQLHLDTCFEAFGARALVKCHLFIT